MAHSLIPETGALCTRATDFLGWGGWKLRLDEAEDTTDLPPPLPQVELTAPPVDIDACRGFVRAATNGEAILVNLMTASLLLPTTSRRIVIRDQPDRGWRWIACLLDLLPQASARHVTISTYQFDTADAADINATVAGSGFSLNPTQREFEFFVFEPEVGLSPSFPNRDPAQLAEATRYAETIVRWYLDDEARFHAFLSFMDSFKPCLVDRSLVTGLMLFDGSLATQQAFGVELERLIAFVREKVLPEHFGRSVELLYRLAGSQAATPQFESIHRIVGMCLEMKAAVGERASASYAFGGWLKLFDLALDRPDQFEARVDQTWQLLVDQFDPAIGYRLLLTDSHMAVLRDCYRRADPAALQMVASYLIKAVQSQGGGAEHPDVTEMALIAARGPQPRPCLAAIFSSLETVRAQAALFARLDNADRSLRPVLAQCLLDLTTQNAAQAWTLRRELFDNGLDDLLLAEFGALIATDDKQAVYRNYLSDASAKAPRYHNEAAGDLARIYWSGLGDSERAKQALDWLTARSSPVVDRSMTGELARYANEALSLGPMPISTIVVQRIGEIARAESICLQPDRPALAQALRAFNESGDSRPLLAAAPGLFEGLRADEYAFVSESLLRRGWSVAKSVEDQATLIETLHHPQLGRALATVYARLVREALKAGRCGDLVAATVFAWIEQVTTPGPIAQTAKLALGGLADELASRREDEIVDVFRKLRQLFNEVPESDKGRYDDALASFGELVRRGEGSLSNTLRNIGHRLFEVANPFRRRH
jgi:hypothetical protein